MDAELPANKALSEPESGQVSKILTLNLGKNFRDLTGKEILRRKREFETKCS